MVLTLSVNRKCGILAPGLYFYLFIYLVGIMESEYLLQDDNETSDLGQ